jgi:hypothetical protein
MKKPTKKELYAKIEELQELYNNMRESADTLSAKTFFQQATINRLEKQLKEKDGKETSEEKGV